MGHQNAQSLRKILWKKDGDKLKKLSCVLIILGLLMAITIHTEVCRQPKCGVESCKERHHHVLHRRKQESDTFTGFVASNQDKSTHVLLQTT